MPQPIAQLLRKVVRLGEGSSAEHGRLEQELPCMDAPVGDRYTVRVPIVENGGTRTERTHRFFFLSGCYRSGTNWVTNLLNLHPKVCVTGEFHFWEVQEGFGRFVSRSWYRASEEPVRQVALDAMENLVRRTMYAASRHKPEATWIGDHTPRKLRGDSGLPGAPRVVVIRDGRDVLVSFAFHLLASAHPSELAPRNRSLAEVFCPQFQQDPDRFRDPTQGFLGDDEWVRRQARAWAEFVQHDAEETRRLRDQGTRVHEVRYEHLHKDTLKERDQLYRFLGLDPSEAESLSPDSKTTPGFGREDLKSHYRKGEAGGWKSMFDDRIRRIFKEEAGETLTKFGYEQDLNW